ncbi:UNVERIFIED_CONTAM: hypothetical protein GTU68_030811 [Idotea baltica]|nr:hypothetical protein [Idotea baltica]
MSRTLLEHYGNPSSSTHPIGWYAEELVAKAREQVAAAIKAEPKEIIFTSGATESNNLAIKGLENPEQKQVITAATEHPAVLDPMRQLAKKGAALTILGVNKEGHIDLEALREALETPTALVSIMLANNEMGCIQDLKAISKLTKAAGCLLHCDATQAIGKLAIDVNDMGIDLLSLSSHKVYGPKGVGLLYIRSGQPKIFLKALQEGGGQERGLRSGTLNVPGIVAFGEACELAENHREEEMLRFRKLGALLLQKIKSTLEEASLNGPEFGEEATITRLPGNLSLHLPGISNMKLLALVNTKLAFSVSSACHAGSAEPSHVLSALGLSAKEQAECIRIGIGRFNSMEEIEAAAQILTDAIKKLLK